MQKVIPVLLGVKQRATEQEAWGPEGPEGPEGPGPSHDPRRGKEAAEADPTAGSSSRLVPYAPHRGHSRDLRPSSCLREAQPPDAGHEPSILNDTDPGGDPRAQRTTRGHNHGNSCRDEPRATAFSPVYFAPDLLSGSPTDPGAEFVYFHLFSRERGNKP